MGSQHADFARYYDSKSACYMWYRLRLYEMTVIHYAAAVLFVVEPPELLKLQIPVDKLHQVPNIWLKDQHLIRIIDINWLYVMNNCINWARHVLHNKSET